MVGPLAFAEQSQTLVHEVRGLGKPNGWRHQLDNELGLEFIYERKWRSFLWVYPGFATKIRQKFISLLLWKPLSHTIERCPTECGQSVG